MFILDSSLVDMMLKHYALEIKYEGLLKILSLKIGKTKCHIAHLKFISLKITCEICSLKLFFNNSIILFGTAVIFLLYLSCFLVNKIHTGHVTRFIISPMVILDVYLNLIPCDYMFLSCHVHAPK